MCEMRGCVFTVPPHSPQKGYSVVCTEHGGHRSQRSQTAGACMREQNQLTSGAAGVERKVPEEVPLVPHTTPGFPFCKLILFLRLGWSHAGQCSGLTPGLSPMHGSVRDWPQSSPGGAQRTLCGAEHQDGSVVCKTNTISPAPSPAPRAPTVPCTKQARSCEHGSEPEQETRGRASVGQHSRKRDTDHSGEAGGLWDAPSTVFTR